MSASALEVELYDGGFADGFTTAAAAVKFLAASGLTADEIGPELDVIYQAAKQRVAQHRSQKANPLAPSSTGGLEL